MVCSLSNDFPHINRWADVSTFVNMGRNHRDRCWPWKKGNKLPYKRKANDMPLTGHGPNGEFVVPYIHLPSRDASINMALSNNTVFLPFFTGEISVHISIGPFGPKRTYIYPSRAA